MPGWGPGGGSGGRADSVAIFDGRDGKDKALMHSGDPTARKSARRSGLAGDISLTRPDVPLSLACGDGTRAPLRARNSSQRRAGLLA